MESITIPVHSVIDVITNSSSEVFVTADERTIIVVKDILKLFLETANIASPVDSVFNVDLVYKGWNDDERVDMIGISEYAPSKVRVSVKEDHAGNYGELVKLLNKLNDVFIGVEFIN